MLVRASHRVIANTGILYARMAITVFISLYSTRLVLAALGADDFGIFALIAGVIAMLGFLNGSMSAASQRFMSFAHGQPNETKQLQIFNVSLAMHLAVGTILIVILELIGIFIFSGAVNIPPGRNEAAQFVFHFVVIGTFFTVLAVPYDAIITARENMLFVAITGLIESLLKLGIAVGITIIEGDKLIAYGMLMGLLPLVLLCIKAGYCHWAYNECRIEPRKYITAKLFSEMFVFSGWAFLATATSMLANYGQGLVLNVFFGVKVNAAQGVANQLSGQLGALAFTMQRALNPVIVKSEGAGNRLSMLKATLMGTKLSFLLAMFMFVPALIEMPFLLNLWLDQVPPYSIVFCRLLLLRQLIEQLYFTLSKSIEAVGDIKSFSIARAAVATFPLFVSYVLFRMGFAPYYLYIVFILYSLTMLFVHLAFANRKCGLAVTQYGVDVVLRSVAVLLLVFIIGSLPLVAMAPSSIRLILVGVLSSVSSVVVVWLFGVNNDERELIKSVMSRVRRLAVR